MNEITYDAKMSDAEALMWRLDNDPQLQSTFGTVTLLDRAPDFDVFKQRLLRASLNMPRLRQRVQSTPGFGPPAWVPHTDFDIDRHVRRVALPKPGSERQLLDLATTICTDPFDRARPLWQFTVVEGLKGGRAAIIQKLHHTIADGESGIRLSLEYLDFERDAIQPEMPTPDEVDEATEDLRDADTRAADAVREVLASSLRIPLGVAQHVKELLADPSRLPAAGAAAGDTLRGIAAQLGDTEKAHSPLWTKRSARRHLEHVVASFDETKRAATTLGGTLNIAFMTIAAEAASRYHIELGTPVDTLRASMAISTRTDESGANAFSLVRFVVPSGDLEIGDRFRAIQAASEAAVSDSSGASLDVLAALAATLPTSIVTRLAHQQASTIDFATSNVRGASVPLYVAGARLLNNVPMGPLSGVAVNMTLLSYNGHLDIGVHSDAAAVDDPGMLRRCLEASIAAFSSLAS